MSRGKTRGEKWGGGGLLKSDTEGLEGKAGVVKWRGRGGWGED